MPRRQKRYQLDRPTTKDLIVGWMVEGKTDPEIVEALRATKRITVTRQAVTAFRKRHRAELEELMAKVSEAVAGLTIAEKAERIRRAEVVGAKLMDWLEQHGPVTVTYIESGKTSAVEHRFNVGLVKSLVELQRYVAQEKGEWVSKSESVLSTPLDDEGEPVPLHIILTPAPAEPKKKGS